MPSWTQEGVMVTGAISAVPANTVGHHNIYTGYDEAGSLSSTGVGHTVLTTTTAAGSPVEWVYTDGTSMTPYNIGQLTRQAQELERIRDEESRRRYFGAPISPAYPELPYPPMYNPLPYSSSPAYPIDNARYIPGPVIIAEGPAPVPAAEPKPVMEERRRFKI